MAYAHQGPGMGMHHNHHPHHIGAQGGHGKGNEKSRVLLLRRLPEGATTKDVEKWVNSRVYMTGGQVRSLKTVCVLLLKDGVALVELESLAMSDSVMAEAEKNPGAFRFGAQIISVHYSTKTQLSRRPTFSVHHPRVLMMLLKQPTGKIPMDEMFWICSQFGRVEKISMVGLKAKDEPQPCDASVNVILASGQALVQFSDPNFAKTAMEHLNGRKVNFTAEDGSGGECIVHASPARVTELTFRVENDTRKDYSRVNEYVSSHYPDELGTVQADLGWAIRDYLWGNCWVPNGQFDPPPCTDPKPSSLLNTEEGMVLKLSGLPLAEGGEHIVSPKVIFRVAAMYGQVVAVKFCYRSPGCCLLQYHDGASTALRHFSQLSLFGRKCSIVVSHHRNATNWNTSEMQKLMHTLDQEPNGAISPAPESVMQSPSAVLLFYTAPDHWTRSDFMNAIGHHMREIGKWKSFSPEQLVKNVDAKGKTVEMVDSDVAFVMGGLLNGAVYEGVLLNVCFSHQGVMLTGAVPPSQPIATSPHVKMPSVPSSPLGKMPTGSPMFGVVGSPVHHQHSSSIPVNMSSSPVSNAMAIPNYSSVCSSPTTGCPPLGSSLHSQQSWGSMTGTSPYTQTSYVINGYGEPLTNFYPEVPSLVVDNGRMSMSSSLSSKDEDDVAVVAGIEEDDDDSLSISSKDFLQGILPAFHKSFDRSALQSASRDSRTAERTKQGRCSSSHR
eukprot:TRINITY_DN1086_c2_g2_i1.p1 TRINITY_DN1086_c2_g2~~TRINITY_DN1086_c2_g2_i1.p1  ORF type:complete len:722 (+),score=157.31 TRINITY_DN1086_c2_g2_i1:139-2304(+)